MCPHCGQDAPIVYRGVLPYCTACGAFRAPLASPSINLAGKPARVGGTVASVAGWLFLLVGLSIALGAGLLSWAIFSATVGLALALPIALFSGVVGALLLRSGYTLRRSGADAETATRDQAILGLAAHHGPLTAADAARALNVTIPVADSLMTELAKRDPERFAVDVDDQGVVWYRAVDPASGLPRSPLPHAPPMRQVPHVRVESGPIVRVPPVGSAAPPASAEEAALEEAAEDEAARAARDPRSIR